MLTAEGAWVILMRSSVVVLAIVITSCYVQEGSSSSLRMKVMRNEMSVS